MKTRTISILLSLVLLVTFLIPGAGADWTDTEEETGVTVTGHLPPADELLAGYLKQEAGVLAALSGSAGRDRLSGLNLALYDILRSAVQEMAAGKRTSTSVEITPEDLPGYTLSWDGGDIQDRLAETGFNQSAVFHALLVDLPFDFYWFNYSIEGAFGFTFSCHTSGSQISINYFVFQFYVSEPYSAGKYQLRSDLGHLIATVRANAQQIVAENAGKSDYEKLSAYKDAICELVTYDTAASENINQADQNPWQLIYVFDGDPNTNVVCEGYSKAFMFLCELSDFSDPGFACYLVHGDFGGPHMWNHVTLDGETYLVDVTNCDEGTVGSPDYLFLREAVSGYNTPETGYQILIERTYRSRAVNTALSWYHRVFGKPSLFESDTAVYTDVDSISDTSRSYYGGSAPFLNLSTTAYDPSASGGGDSGNGGGGSGLPVYHSVTVTNGSGSGTYAAGETVEFSAGTLPEGAVLVGWNTSANVQLNFTGGTGQGFFTMPNDSVWLGAVYEEPDGEGTRKVCVVSDADSAAVWIETEGALEGTLCVVSYGEDGAFLSLEAVPFADGVGEAQPDLDGAAELYAFVVDENLRPLTAKVPVPLP